MQPQKGITRIKDLWVYPSEYFCPINITTNRLHITPNTRTIHHYTGTWIGKRFYFKKFLKRFIPEQWLLAYSSIKAKTKQT